MSNIYYLPTHEYARVEGNVAYIGISEFAAKSLGNVVYVDMPEDGDDVVKGEDFGAVESVKAASDLMAPVSGVVEEVNEILDDEPERINADAFANWIVKIKLADPSELGKLMNAKDYEASLAD